MAQKPRAVSAPHCDTIHLARLGVTRRGSALKVRGIAAACAVEKKREREIDQAKTLNAAPWRPAPKIIWCKKRDSRKKHGAVCGHCVNAVRVSLFSFEFFLGWLRRFGAPSQGDSKQKRD